MTKERYKLPDGTMVDHIPKGYSPVPQSIQAANKQQGMASKATTWLIPITAIGIKKAFEDGTPEFISKFGNTMSDTLKESVSKGLGAIKDTLLGKGVDSVASAAAPVAEAAASPVADAITSTASGFAPGSTAEMGTMLLDDTGGLATSSGAGLQTPIGDSLGTTTSALSPLAQGGLGAAGVLGGIYGLAKDWGKETPISGGLSGASIAGGLGALGGSLGLESAGALLGPWGIAGGALLGALLGNIKSGKHDDNKKRSKLRDYLVDQGFAERGIEGGYNTSGNGTYLPYLGKDGEVKYFDISGEGADSEALDPHGYNVSASESPWVGAVNPLAAIISGGDDKLGSDFAGYIASLPAASGDPRGTLKQLYEKAGLGHDEAFAALTELRNSGKITEDEHLAYNNAINEIFDDSREISKGTFVSDIADSEALVNAMAGTGVSGIAPVAKTDTTVAAPVATVADNLTQSLITPVQKINSANVEQIAQDMKDAGGTTLTPSAFATDGKTADIIQGLISHNPSGHTAGEIFGGTPSIQAPVLAIAPFQKKGMSLGEKIALAKSLGQI